jgi:hypothetical protein
LLSKIHLVKSGVVKDMLKYLLVKWIITKEFAVFIQNYISLFMINETFLDTLIIKRIY